MSERKMFTPVVAIAVGVMVAVNPVGKAGAAGSMNAFDAANATYSFEGDTFTLAAGKTQIMGHSGLSGAPAVTIPIGYTLGKSASGELAGSAGEAVALCRNFGANLQWITLFAFASKNGAYAQIAAGPVYQEDASLQSLSVAEGIVTVKLLVVGDADKLRPRYAQKPTQPLTLQFKIEDGKFVKASSN